MRFRAFSPWIQGLNEVMSAMADVERAKAMKKKVRSRRPQCKSRNPVVNRQVRAIAFHRRG